MSVFFGEVTAPTRGNSATGIQPVIVASRSTHLRTFRERGGRLLDIGARFYKNQGFDVNGPVSMSDSRDFTIILASSSPYRRQLLDKLFDDFLSISPDIDESPKPGETPIELARRLSAEKANAVAKHPSTHQLKPPALVIGSDQVVSLHGQLLGKPGSTAKAIEQLRSCSGQSLEFHTGLALINTSNGQLSTEVVSDRLRFRSLSEDSIQRYVEKEQPLDCAGSIKTESLGIALIEEMSCQDPNHLIGLPLIALCSLLEKHGLNIV